jgi:bifunctional UDP-N-acetylglucosamine pyrophosphorylase/glucosamine-1-phosphate N-acetyltransferase
VNPDANLPTEADAAPPRTAVIVLAAGHGTRLKSSVPKHLHTVAGVPIVERVIRAGFGSHPAETIALVSPGMANLPERLGMEGAFRTVIQDPPQGTGAAVRIGVEALTSGVDYIVSLLGDSPLLTGEIVDDLVTAAVASRARVTVLTAMLEDRQAYGRIARDVDDRPVAIIEKKSDTHYVPAGLTEINSGIMVIEASWGREALHRIEPNAESGEYQLTDLIELAVGDHREGEPWPVATHVADGKVAIGVNDRHQLLEAETLARAAVRERLLDSGVTLIGPETIFIDEDVDVGRDTVILPHSIISGSCRIGARCEIGPSANLRDVIFGDDVHVQSSTVRESTVGNRVLIGPYAHLRGGCMIHDDARIGTSTELKGTTVGKRSSVGHFGYLGDATLGDRVNIGAGTITANFDGVTKHPTTIGDHVFIGSDSVLVAPVTIGDRAKTGAGAVVTRDVAADSLVVGVPAKPRTPSTDQE